MVGTFVSTIILSLHQNGRGFLRLSKNLYNEKGRPPYPYKSAKSRDLCVAFCTSQGRGAPLVRWPDGHTFFAFLHRTCPAWERSMGAEALRQPLAKTRKSSLSHFFDTLKRRGPHPLRFCFLIYLMPTLSGFLMRGSFQW